GGRSSRNRTGRGRARRDAAERRRTAGRHGRQSAADRPSAAGAGVGVSVLLAAAVPAEKRKGGTMKKTLLFTLSCTLWLAVGAFAGQVVLAAQDTKKPAPAASKPTEPPKPVAAASGAQKNETEHVNKTPSRISPELQV